MTGQSPQSTGLSNRAIARLVGAGVVLVLLVVFVLQNRDSVDIHFLFWTANFAVAWALIIAGILGVLFGLVLTRLRRLL